MGRNRIIVIALVGLMVAVLALGWLVGVSPLLTQANSAMDEASNLTTVNNAGDAKVVVLKKQFADIDKLKATAVPLRASIPETVDAPTFLREIYAFCAQYGVTLTSVKVGVPIDYVAPNAPGTNATTPTTPTATPTPAPTPGGSGTTSGTAKSSLVLIPMKVIISGPYPNVMAFTDALQQGARLFFISKITTGPSPLGVLTVLDGSVYALPASGGAAGVAEGSTNTPTPTPNPTETPSATPTNTPSPTPTG